MDNLQWNVNVLFTRIPESDIIRRQYAAAAVYLQETHLCPAHTTLLRGYTSYWYNRVNGDTAVFV
jgi:hypothetical protein